MYTDGVTEAMNGRQELFSEERMKKEVSLHQQDSIKELATGMLQKIKSFSRGMPQSDDITILVLRYFHDNNKSLSGFEENPHNSH